ncbi:MAG TPA: hypothetical protein VKE94_05270 [Gemmataceae bacterium]|nr:hypothetical protein [Gemmataceae bacterium]
MQASGLTATGLPALAIRNGAKVAIRVDWIWLCAEFVLVHRMTTGF